ncbi:hypothetical protein LMG33818_002288 [Halomonadaceae bacterium LMG 33818]|uniref:hypothetical protein n=1 Tax=Cernens ardua TaxID=3402176 RepID=UPI003EDBC65A
MSDSMAFPSLNLSSIDKPKMTDSDIELRDWFAGQAITGFEVDKIKGIPYQQREHLRNVATMAYKMADAMMSARK